MSHISRTTSERKALNNVIHVADGMTPSSKSRTASVAAGWAITGQQPPSSARRSSSPQGVIGGTDALVVWDQSGPVSDHIDPTIKPCAKFTGFTQCMLSVQWVDAVPDKDTVLHEEVWLADGDGRIVIRTLGSVGAKPHAHADAINESLNGKSIGKETVAVIKKYFGVFVTALERGGPNVWAGYSDGAVRAFSIKTRKEVFESPKHHGGSINRLLFVEAPGDYGHRNPLMISASEDFRIHAYHVDTFSFVFQLTASGSCVRCMATDGDYLFTGGDDGMVRCWSLEQKSEMKIPGVYPLHAYQEGGVRSLDLHQNALFACGGSCGSMWDVEDGSLLAVFNVPDQVKAVRSTIVPSGFTLWISASDGFVYIFDISDLSLVEVADCHAASLVKCVEVVHRAPVLQTVATYPDGFVYAYSETGRLAASYTHLPEELQQKLAHLQRSQEEISRQRIEIRRQAATMRKYKSLFAQFRGASAKAMQASRASAVATTSSRAAAAKKQQHWNQTVFTTASTHLSDSCLRNTIHRMFRRWGHTAYSLSYSRSQRVLGEALLHNAQQSFQGSCVRSVITAQRKRERHDSLQHIAADLLRRVHVVQSIRFLDMWKYLLKRNKLIAKQQDMASLLEKRVQTSYCATQLKTWIAYRSERKAARLEQAAQESTKAAEVHLGLERIRSQSHEEAKREAFLERRSSLAILLLANTQTRNVREYFAAWLTKAVVGAQHRRERAVTEMERKVASLVNELEEIEANSSISDEDIERQITIKEAEVAAMEAAVRARELVILQMRDVEQDIMRRMKASGVKIPDDLPKPPAGAESILMGDRAKSSINGGVDRSSPAPPTHDDVSICDNIMKTLAQRGFNCRSHWDVILDAGKLAAARPGQTFVKSLELAKAELVEAFGAQPVPNPPPPGPVLLSSKPGTSTRQPIARLVPQPTAGRGVARSTSTSRSTASAAPRSPSATVTKSVRPGSSTSSKPASVSTLPTASPELLWNVNMTLVEKSNRIVLKRVVSGLRRAVVAWYHLRTKLNADTDRLKNLSEIQVNATLWIQLLERERTLEDAALERDPKLPWGGSAAGGSSRAMLLTPIPSSANLARRGSGAGTPTPGIASASVPRLAAVRSASSSNRLAALSTPRGQVTNEPRSTTPRATRAATPSAASRTSTAPAASERSARYPMAHRVTAPSSTTTRATRSGAAAAPSIQATTPARPTRPQQPATERTPATAREPSPRGASPRASSLRSSSPRSPPPSAAATARRGASATASSPTARRTLSPVVTESVF
jgi:WD40 repeat protein